MRVSWEDHCTPLPHISLTIFNFPGVVPVLYKFLFRLVENKALSHFCQVKYSHRFSWRSPPQDADVNFAAGTYSLQRKHLRGHGGWFQYQRLSLHLALFSAMTPFNTPLTSGSALFTTTNMTSTRYLQTAPPSAALLSPLLSNLSPRDTSLPPSISVLSVRR